MTTVIICGGRDWTNTKLSFEILDQIHSTFPITRVIDGAARGADTVGWLWATSRRIPTERHPANWNLHGKSAGYKRNVAMAYALQGHDPEHGYVIAFPGGKGTQHMIDIATKHGITVIQPLAT